MIDQESGIFAVTYKFFSLLLCHGLKRILLPWVTKNPPIVNLIVPSSTNGPHKNCKQWSALQGMYQRRTKKSISLICVAHLARNVQKYLLKSLLLFFSCKNRRKEQELATITSSSSSLSLSYFTAKHFIFLPRNMETSHDRSAPALNLVEGSTL